MKWRLLVTASILIVGNLALSGCTFNRYRHVDTGPDGKPLAFRGVDDYLQHADAVHVVLVHGMGDHPAETDCSPGSVNAALQDRIAERLSPPFVRDAEYGASQPQPVSVGRVVAGSYTTRKYRGPGSKALYISCLTWGEASRNLKKALLELDDAFLETNEHERYRTRLNREAKRFVNRSFSDPVLYVGSFGAFLRAAAWTTTMAAVEAHRTAGAQLDTTPIVVVSDSLGSRVMFDALCERQVECNRAADSLDAAATQAMRRITDNIVAVHMFANQLPLLALGNVPVPGPDQSLDDVVASTCFLPTAEVVVATTAPVEIVAYTDVNDALSYYLSRDFRERCDGDGQLRFVNVATVNARTALLGIYTSLGKAHAVGFKSNPEALSYLVQGNHP